MKESSDILVYTSHLTNRVRYTFKLMCTNLLGLNVIFTDDKEELAVHDGAALNYSHKQQGNELFFKAHGLLAKSGIEEHDIQVFEWEGVPCFFGGTTAAAVPFDPFAAAFYLVSRYEEYLPHIRDHYGRYEAKESLAYRNNFLRKPVVNIWAAIVGEKIKAHYPNITLKAPSFQYISTIDIDNAYAFKEKGLMRTVGAYARSLMKLDFKETMRRTGVLLGSQQDPYDTYDYQLELQRKYNLKTIYFFLLADYGLNDKNVPVSSTRFQSLIKSLADYADVGIHPSFGSNFNADKLPKEIKRLANITKKEVTRSRQHFLMLSLPETYRKLIDNDITDDYTMGYASEVGFRAGICVPYQHYDLDMDTPTPLRIHPFAVMEGTLNEYMQVSVEEAIDIVKELMDEVKAVNGTFISLWHNETMNDEKKWEGWRVVYEKTIEMACS